jgi:hypothetical protein
MRTQEKPEAFPHCCSEKCRSSKEKYKTGTGKQNDQQQRKQDDGGNNALLEHHDAFL